MQSHVPALLLLLLLLQQLQLLTTEEPSSAPSPPPPLYTQTHADPSQRCGVLMQGEGMVHYLGTGKLVLMYPPPPPPSLGEEE